MKVIKTFLMVLWQLPQDLLGAIICLVCRIRKRTCHCQDDRIFVEWGLYSGLSLGHFIFVHTTDVTTTVKHEYGHTLQSHYLGWLYLLVIGLPSIIWAGCFDRYRARKGVSYYSFYTERWADKLGGITR